MYVDIQEDYINKRTDGIYLRGFSIVNNTLSIVHPPLVLSGK